MSIFAHLIACSLYAAAFGSFAYSLLSHVTGLSFPDTLGMVISVGLLVSLLWANFRGAGNTGRLEVIITGLQIAILLVVIAYGLRLIFTSSSGASALTPFFPEGFSGVLSAMGMTFVAFEGYEVIVQSREEVKNPDRAIPRAIFLTIAIAVVIYLLIALVMLAAVKAPEGQSVYNYLAQLKEMGIIKAAGQFVPHGEMILLFAGLASTASALNATIYGSSRIAFAMGRDGDLPAALGSIHQTTRTPYMAILMTGVLMIIMTVALPIKDIAASTNIMFLLVFILVCATLIRLRRRWPDRKRPFRVSLSPWLPSVGIIAGLVLSVWLLQVSLIAWVVAISWLILGGILFLIRRQSHEADWH